MKGSPGSTPNLQSPRSCDGVIGKNGGDIIRARNLLRVGVVALVRQQQAHPCVLTIAAREEGQALHVVPVQVRQQDGAPEREVGEQIGQTAQARPGVEEQCGRGRGASVVVRQCDARRVPAKADVVGAGRGGRAPGPAESDAHRISLAAVLAAMSRGELLQMRALDEIRVEQGDPARRHGDVARRADAAFEVRALAEQRPRPVLGQPFPAPLDADDAVEDQEDLASRLSLGEEDGAGGKALNAALGATLHQLRGEGCLERRLDGGHQTPRSPRRPTGCACRRTCGTNP